MSPTPENASADEAARQELRRIAARLRQLGSATRELEVVCHDLARIMERLAGARGPAEVERMAVCLFVLDDAGTGSWVPQSAVGEPAPEPHRRTR